MAKFNIAILSIVVLTFSGCVGIGAPLLSPQLNVKNAAALLDHDRPLPAERLIQATIEKCEKKMDDAGLALAYGAYAGFLQSPTVTAREGHYKKSGFMDPTVTFENRFEKAREYWQKALKLYEKNNSSGREQNPSIKIIYETKVESPRKDKFAVPEREPEDSKLKYDKAFKSSAGTHLLKRDDDNYLREATKSNKAREALDAQRVSEELYEALKNGFAKRGFPISNEQGNYVVSFTVNEITYDDYKGECYITSASYKLLRGTEILYQGNFLPEKKKTWFSGGEYRQLTKTSRIANKIINDLSDKIFDR